MALIRRAGPVHVLVAAYNLVLGAVWLAHWRHTPYAPGIAAARGPMSLMLVETGATVGGSISIGPSTSEKE